jgi:hypothetical protein
MRNTFSTQGSNPMQDNEIILRVPVGFIRLCRENALIRIINFSVVICGFMTKHSHESQPADPMTNSLAKFSNAYKKNDRQIIIRRSFQIKNLLNMFF